jgi:ribosomal protein L25 (general stress protein Ctc)
MGVQMTKGERREAKRLNAKHRIPRHGGSLAIVYANAIKKHNLQRVMKEKIS